MDIYRVHVSLRRIEPFIWRRIELSSQTTLKQLHRILQIAMGWENYHLHEYIVDGRRYGTPDPAYDSPGEIIRETVVRLATVLPQPGAEILYVYDFGDYWQHDLRLEAVFLAESGIKYPAGGLSADHQRWIHIRHPRFLLPIPVLRKVFRNKFTDGLEQLYRKGLLDCGGPAKALADQAHFSELLEKLRHKEWVVYAKPPFGEPAHVLRYLGRYTHSIAISNHRLLGFDGEKVAFRYKDYAHGGKQRIMTLHASEFLRRFFLHVLPRGFVRIRHFGLLANRFRKQMLPLARTLLANDSRPPLPQPAPMTPTEVAPLWHCPRCGGPMRVARRLTAAQLYLEQLDSS